MLCANLNTNIVIEKETTSTNSVGTPIETYATLKSTWAQLKYNSGNTEFNEGAQPFSDIDFTIRYDSNINYKCRVKLPFENIEIAPTLISPNYTLGSGWSYGTSKIIKNVDGVGTVTPVTLAVTIGKVYMVRIHVSSISVSTANWTLGGVSGAALNKVGTFQSIITASSTGKLIITPVATGLRMEIDNISIKEMTYEYYKILAIELLGRKDGMRLRTIKWDTNG